MPVQDHGISGPAPVTDTIGPQLKIIKDDNQDALFHARKKERLIGRIYKKEQFQVCNHVTKIPLRNKEQTYRRHVG